ncbi:MAG TPA: alcohol dehydrogenase catalytic domain-containing protein [Sedimentisphaerales bacterium]|nr:alcohol dehydrogenase catalytic domain-containing protein [Sedimentisphaerales bacterium]
MRQAVMTEPGRIEFRDVPEPKAGAGQILLRVRQIGVCGSDVHVNHGKHPFTSYPVVQGHEFSAQVEAVGPGVRNIKPGMKATARPQLVCGKCRPCRRGDYNICDVLKVQGFQAPGCAQDLFVTTTDRVVPLPNSLTFEQGALVEPAAVAVHSTGRAGDLKGKNVAVLGAGPIGNLVAQVARCRGAKKILITDLSDFRLEIAKKCGIRNTCNAGVEPLAEASHRVFGSKGFDVAFEAVGVEATMAAAVDAIQKGGRIVVLGVFGEKPRIDMSIVGDRELSLIGTLMYKHEDYVRAVQLIAKGKVITKPLVTKHFLFEQYAEAYKFIDEQGDKTLKVMIDL